MATTKSRVKKPLKVKLLNAAGNVIEGIILAGHFPKEEPGLAIADELGKHKDLIPKAIP